MMPLVGDLSSQTTPQYIFGEAYNRAVSAVNEYRVKTGLLMLLDVRRFDIGGGLDFAFDKRFRAVNHDRRLAALNLHAAERPQRDRAVKLRRGEFAHQHWNAQFLRQRLQPRAEIDRIAYAGVVIADLRPDIADHSVA